MTRTRIERPSRASWRRVVLCVSSAAILGSACAKASAPADKSRKNRPIPVAVAAVVQKDMPLALETFGRAQSKSSVTVKAQVTRVLQTVHFEEGQKVARGELLFTLDNRPFAVALTHAAATLARDKALFANAQADLRRAEEMLAKKAVAPADYDKAKFTADALAETLVADQASIDAARIGLDNCTIASPIDGRAGKLLVHAGNLVTSDDTPLVVLNQISPIDVLFSLPQAELDRIRACQGQGELVVEATLPSEPDRPEKGALTFIDNRIDAASGTIELGATFPNADEHLWPGRYVLVHLVLSVQRDALVVPRRALEAGAGGQYVFVVKDGQTAELRPVKVARSVGDEAVIETGLQLGEQVVTDGQLQLEDGTKVEIGAKGTSAPPHGAAAPASAGPRP